MALIVSWLWPKHNVGTEMVRVTSDRTFLFIMVVNKRHRAVAGPLGRASCKPSCGRQYSWKPGERANPPSLTVPPQRGCRAGDPGVGLLAPGLVQADPLGLMTCRQPKPQTIQASWHALVVRPAEPGAFQCIRPRAERFSLSWDRKPSSLHLAGS